VSNIYVWQLFDYALDTPVQVFDLNAGYLLRDPLPQDAAEGLELVFVEALNGIHHLF
jgi:hypothetical protein